MLYAVIIPDGEKRICTSWAEAEQLISTSCFAIYRKFFNYDAALKFLTTREARKTLSRLKGFGDILSNCHLKINYMFDSNSIYINIDRSLLPNVTLSSRDDLCINYSRNIIAIKENLVLSRDKLSPHIIIINEILEIVGDFIDIELFIPYNSIYYVLEKYNGTNIKIRSIQDRIKSRRGNIAYTTL